jgi:tetraacyldisaccharide 4'-kinase
MPAFWYKPYPTLASHVLTPLAWLYAKAAALHGALRARTPYYAAVPVISVGNVVVGGAGKTPVVQWLATYFAMQGKHVAIVARGYGGHATTATHVQPNHTAADVGDEPLMLTQHFTGKPVHIWVGRHRPSVVARAEQSGADIIILDDGYQRHDVARTLNILVVDGTVGFGNGQPLPAGPLREDASARTRADFAIIINPPEGKPNFLGIRAYRLTTQPDMAVMQSLKAQKIIAFAGLAHPSKFFNMLRQHKLNVVHMVPYPDHHPYTAADMRHLKNLALQHDAKLVCTSKDAPKLPTDFATSLPINLAGPDTENILAEIEAKIG